MEANKCVLVRRDTREKIECSLDDLETKVAELLEQIQKDMLEHARAHRDAHTYTAKNMETASAKTRSKKMYRQHPDVCHLSRNILQIPAYAAANLLQRWFTGDVHTKTKGR